MRILSLTILAVFFIEATAGVLPDICRQVASEVPLLRAEQRLKKESTITVGRSTYTYDRYLGSKERDLTQSSAVFLSSDSRSVIKMYPVEEADQKAPEREYWMTKYLIESGITVPKTKGRPVLISTDRLDEQTRQFLQNVGISSAKVRVLVKEYTPGFTEKELRSRSDIAADELSRLLNERDTLRNKIQKLFLNNQFDIWLRSQGVAATKLAGTHMTNADLEDKNFLLTEQGWILFDP